MSRATTRLHRVQKGNPLFDDLYNLEMGHLYGGPFCYIQHNSNSHIDR